MQSSLLTPMLVCPLLFIKIRPMLFVQYINLNPKHPKPVECSQARLRLFVYRLLFQKTTFSFPILKIGIFRQIVSLIFPSDDKGRARSAENVSIHISFSYGMFKKKAAHRAEKILKFHIIFLNFA